MFLLLICLINDLIFNKDFQLKHFIYSKLNYGNFFEMPYTFYVNNL